MNVSNIMKNIIMPLADMHYFPGGDKDIYKKASVKESPESDLNFKSVQGIF
jgi:hypothetical protein